VFFLVYLWFLAMAMSLGLAIHVSVAMQGYVLVIANPWEGSPDWLVCVFIDYTILPSRKHSLCRLFQFFQRYIPIKVI
jgi:membrane-associated PAP2 superfamily phosphatase